jgi:protein-S-isoprenylcysteine O-methyltransferase Ste14
MFAFIIAFVVWALIHSLATARPVKAWARRKMGARAYAGFYRLFYNIIAVLSFVPVLRALARGVPFRTVWRWPRPFHWLALFLELVGAVGVIVTLWQKQPLTFAGVRQVIRYLQGEADPDPPMPFVRSRVYALVRHPLYFFSMLFLWFTPVLTLNRLLFNLLSSLYFWLGSRHEERRLQAALGSAYERYCKEVPALLPFLR